MYKSNLWKDSESKMTMSSKPINRSLQRSKIGHYLLWWFEVSNYFHWLVFQDHPTRALLVDSNSMTSTRHHQKLLIDRPLMLLGENPDNGTRLPTPSHRRPVFIPTTSKLTTPFKTWHSSGNSCRWTNKATTIDTSRKSRATISCPTNHALLIRDHANQLANWSSNSLL